MNFPFPKQFAGTAPWLAIAFLAGTVIVHIGFAAAVARDANQLRRDRSGPLIVGPFLWALATLLGGVFVAGIYWLINHSVLSRR